MVDVLRPVPDSGSAPHYCSESRIPFSIFYPFSNQQTDTVSAQNFAVSIAEAQLSMQSADDALSASRRAVLNTIDLVLVIAFTAELLFNIFAN